MNINDNNELSNFLFEIGKKGKKSFIELKSIVRNFKI